MNVIARLIIKVMAVGKWVQSSLGPAENSCRMCLGGFGSRDSKREYVFIGSCPLLVKDSLVLPGLPMHHNGGVSLCRRDPK